MGAFLSRILVWRRKSSIGPPIHTSPSPTSASHYDVTVGDTFCGRYTVISKLGAGVTSTVWLAHDSQLKSQVAIKILTVESTDTVDERNLMLTAKKSSLTHEGYQHVIQLLDHFQLTSKLGNHECLVLELVDANLDHLRQLDDDSLGPLPIPVVKQVARDILLGLSYLHESCGIIHTDIKPDNVFWKRNEETLLQSSTQTATPDESVVSGLFKIGDLGQGNWVHKRFTEQITAPALRAPEVIICAGWDTPADIWSLGCLIYEITTGVALFNPYFQCEQLNAHPGLIHLGQIIGLCGKFPADFLASGARSLCWFDKKGILRHTPGTPISMERLLKMRVSEDSTDVDGLASFLCSMLRLRPEDRLTASQLISHPWLAK